MNKKHYVWTTGKDVGYDLYDAVAKDGLASFYDSKYRSRFEQLKSNLDTTHVVRHYNGRHTTVRVVPATEVNFSKLIRSGNIDVNRALQALTDPSTEHARTLANGDVVANVANELLEPYIDSNVPLTAYVEADISSDEIRENYLRECRLIEEFVKSRIDCIVSYDFSDKGAFLKIDLNNSTRANIFYETATHKLYAMKIIELFNSEYRFTSPYWEYPSSPPA
jgi:hypothetical protein